MRRRDEAAIACAEDEVLRDLLNAEVIPADQPACTVVRGVATVGKISLSLELVLLYPDPRAANSAYTEACMFRWMRAVWMSRTTTLTLRAE